MAFSWEVIVVERGVAAREGGLPIVVERGVAAREGGLPELKCKGALVVEAGGGLGGGLLLVLRRGFPFPPLKIALMLLPLFSLEVVLALGFCWAGESHE